MNIPQPKDLIAQLRGRIMDPARQAIVEALAQDVTQLQVRALAGEDVQREMAHVKAQAASLTATEAAFVREAVLGWVGEIARVVVGAAFAAA